MPGMACFPQLSNDDSGTLCLQNLTYLVQPRYNEAMAAWLSSAARMADDDQLRAYCSTDLPDDSKGKADMYVTYRTPTEFGTYASALTPMREDFRVSWGCWYIGPRRNRATFQCRMGSYRDSHCPAIPRLRFIPLQVFRAWPALAHQPAHWLSTVCTHPQQGHPRIPRGSYQGIVAVRCRGRRVFLVPASSGLLPPS